MQWNTYTDQIAITGDTVYHKVAKLIDARAKLKQLYWSGRQMGKTWVTARYLEHNLDYDLNFVAEIGVKRVAYQVQMPEVPMLIGELGHYDGMLLPGMEVPLVIDLKTNRSQQLKPRQHQSRMLQQMQQQIQQ